MEEIIFDLSMLLVGAAFLAYIAVLLKQPIIIAYIACGVLIGPWGFGLIEDVGFIEAISHLGIILLLFLAGLCLHPQKLLGLFKKTSVVTLVSCLSSFGIAFAFSLLFRFSLTDSLCIALALMFSSTILSVKLLPTTTLHQKRMGAVCISILIMQDLLAIAVLVFIHSLGAMRSPIVSFALLFLKLCVFLGILVLFEQFVLRKVMYRVERLHEELFILGLAWCFGVASIANHMGLLYETGAFFAGVVLARHRISFFISERLKPLRDFFLVLFFFTLGAKLNVMVMKNIFVPALILATIFILVKPWIFQKAFLRAGESLGFAKETGLRLGQLSEFSILIAFLAFQLGHISQEASQLIQLTTIFTFIASSYLVVFQCKTPIGPTEDLIRD